MSNQMMSNQMISAGLSEKASSKASASATCPTLYLTNAMVDFTIAIPTYNGEHRLPDVLERLRSQQIHFTPFTWEVIVVDNNSQDGTAAVVEAFRANFPCPLRYYLEPQQGSAYARKTAIREAQSDLVGFLDDDNLPDPNWITTAYEFAQTHPKAGAIASRIRGEFEVEPPPNLAPLLPFLAITERGAKALQYNSCKKVLPPSAGLVVRKSVWLAHVPQQTILAGRVKGDMLAGEDTEVLAYIRQSNWEVWYNPEMKIAHKIPAWRLEREYLIPLLRGIGLSRYVTRMVGIKPWQRSFIAAAYMMHDLHKIVVHLLRYRDRIKTDLVAACELELFVNSLISPIYLWRNGYLGKARKISS